MPESTQHHLNWFVFCLIGPQLRIGIPQRTHSLGRESVGKKGASRLRPCSFHVYGVWLPFLPTLFHTFSLLKTYTTSCHSLSLLPLSSIRSHSFHALPFIPFYFSHLDINNSIFIPLRSTPFHSIITLFHYFLLLYPTDPSFLLLFISHFIPFIFIPHPPHTHEKKRDANGLNPCPRSHKVKSINRIFFNLCLLLIYEILFYMFTCHTYITSP